MHKITPFVRPPLDPEFLPAAIWNRALSSTEVSGLFTSGGVISQ